jgi:peptidoglycan/LPS O-acetylase OafA/YrhL
MTIPNIFGLAPHTADYIGFAGMACIIIAYAYIVGVEKPNPYIQHGANLLGAILLAISLTVHTNKASMVLEAFWAAIAIWGLAKAALGKGKKT